ncbi:MAG: arylsulfatase [Pirellulaceae bacterium]|nr:arylsulfatase [Pirellulaceae bacterium]
MLRDRLPLVLTFAAVLVACELPAAAADNRSLPNIVLILADDLGHGHISHLNPQSKIRTPHIDKLASQGISLTDAHSGSAVCSPTRYGLLTGRYAWRTKLVRGVLGPYDPPLIEATRLTLPGMLKKHGYHTACVGKWHLGWDWPRKAMEDPDFSQPIAGGPTTRGFDYYFGTDVPNYPPYCFIENDQTVGLPNSAKTERNLDGRPGPMLAGWKFDAILPALADKAASYIAERAAAKQPFFLYLPLTSPHEPIAPSAEFRGQSGLNSLGDFLLETDAVVGKVAAAIEQHKLAESTLFIFTCDNGSSLYTGGAELVKLGHAPSAGWRGAKTSIYEGGHRVPFVARWPGVIPTGAKSGETICLTDLLATAAEIVGEKLPENAGEDSHSVLPILRGDKLAKPVREATVHQSASGQLAIRQGPWKLITPQPASGAKGKSTEPREAELYNLAADPAETKNVIAEHGDVGARLTTLLDQYRQSGRSRP